MARRSGRLSSNGDKTQSRHKRVLSGNAETQTSTKRARQQQVDSDHSQLFDDEDISSEEEVSEFDDDQNVSASSAAATDDDDDEESDFAAPSKGTKTARGRVSVASPDQPNQHVWKPGVKTGLGPGRQVIIKKPKPRAAGSTPYTDETLHPNTLLFLDELKANNNREWLKSK